MLLAPISIDSDLLAYAGQEIAPPERQPVARQGASIVLAGLGKAYGHGACCKAST